MLLPYLLVKPASRLKIEIFLIEQSHTLIEQSFALVEQSSLLCYVAVVLLLTCGIAIAGSYVLLFIFSLIF